MTTTTKSNGLTDRQIYDEALRKATQDYQEAIKPFWLRYLETVEKAKAAFEKARYDNH